MKLVIRLNPKDNVVVALQPLKKGTVLDDYRVTLLEDIPQGHKICIQKVNSGGNIIKYGSPIGHAIEEIASGSWIHTHNMKTNLSTKLSYQYKPEKNNNPFKLENKTFLGYRRRNGKVGVRNDLYIVPTVGCINGIAESIKNVYQEEGKNQNAFEHIIVMKHPFGCSQLGEDHENTRKILADIVNHPNAGGVLVVGLGCENNTIPEFRKSVGDYDETRVKFLIAQEVEDEISAGVDLINQIAENAQDDQREAFPLSKLKVGLKCGGSDGFSGITANPLLGRFSDYLIAQGGTSVLTEVPEMFGAEQILMARAKNEEVFQKIVKLINGFKDYYLSHNEPVYENPSPGNKEGGITTLEDKSLGCTQKAGTCEVVDVIEYGGKLKEKGLNLLQGPGNDLIAASNLAASDCQIVLFTTGRGTPFGTFVPTIKVATNNEIFSKKKHWMDFNAGRLLKENDEEVLSDFIDKIIAVASGDETKNEKHHYSELAIFKTGVTL